MSTREQLKAGVSGAEIWPHLLSFKLALRETDEVQAVLAGANRPVAPTKTLEQAWQDADEEVMEWCAQAVDEAEAGKGRKGKEGGGKKEKKKK